MKILNPRVHGYLDYVLVALFLLAPTLFGLSSVPSIISYALAGIHFTETVLTAFPLGLVSLLPFTVHGAIEFLISFVLIAMPWIAGFVPAGKRGDTKLSTILNSPGTFDDKMIVVDASDRGENRGNALPLLLDLARTNIFLHDASVSSLDELLNPPRGASAPHPFYIADASQRADMVEFLRGLDTSGSSQERSAAATINKNQSTPTFAPKTLPQFGSSLRSVCLFLMSGLVGLKIRSMF